MIEGIMWPSLATSRVTMVLEQQSMSDLVDAIKHLEQSFDALPEFTADAGADNDRIAEILTLVAEKMHDNYPYAHPMYAGQMIKPWKKRLSRILRQSMVGESGTSDI
ncbi:MAG: hypothetical protein VW882_12905 [Gammaproteobacteria bacterium]